MGFLRNVLLAIGYPLDTPERTQIGPEEYWDRARRAGLPEADPDVCYCGRPAAVLGTAREPYRARCHEHLHVKAWSNQGPGGTWVPHVDCTSDRHPGETVSHWEARGCYRCREIEERFRQIWDGTVVQGVY